MCLGTTKANFPCKRKEHPYCYQHLPVKAGVTNEKSKTSKLESKENGLITSKKATKTASKKMNNDKKHCRPDDDEFDIGDMHESAKLSGTDTENDDTEEESPKLTYSEHLNQDKITTDIKTTGHSSSHQCFALTTKETRCKNMIKDKDQIHCHVHKVKAEESTKEVQHTSISAKPLSPHQCLGTTKENIRCKIVIKDNDELYCHHHYTQDTNTKRMDVDKHKCNGVKPNGEPCQRNLKSKKYCHDHIHQDPNKESAVIQIIGKSDINEIKKTFGECCECGAHIDFGFYCGTHFVEEIAWINKYLKDLDLSRLLGMPATILKKFAYRIYKGISIGDGVGFIYAYSNLSQTTINNEVGDFKVGRALDTDGRIGQWEKDCGNKYKNQFQLQFNHYKIAETLIHYELQGLGYRNDSKHCHSCQRDHIEWFRCDISEIKRVINEWNKYLLLYVDQ